MVHEQSDAVSPKVADVLDKVMSQDTPSQPSSSPQQQRQHSHQSSPILTPTPASPSRPSTPPPSEKLFPVTSMVTSTPVHEDAPRSEVLYSGYRSELNDSLDKSGPEDEEDYSDEQYGARSPGCGSGTYTNDSYSDRRLNYDNSMSPDKDDGENRRSPGGPPPFPPSPYRHFPASSVAVFNSAISGYPPDFARMRFRAYDQMASTESTTSVTYSYGTPPKDSHPDRYPYERDEGAESPGYRSGSDRERGPQFSPSHDRYSRYSSREDAGDSMKLNRSFSPKREGSSPNDTSFLNSTDNMSNASRSPKSLYPHSPGNGGVFPRDPRDSPRGYRHPEMLSPSSAGKMRPMFEGGLPHMPLPPRFGDSGMPLPHPQPPPSAVDGKTHVFFCHLCSYSGPTKEEFDAHMSIHFEYNCPHCDYTSRTEGRLKRHIKDFHTDPENKQRTMPGRPKIFRCKQCEFSCINKVEFWAHARTHIKEDKLLQCPRCPFVTEYKHHLEYHLRNHFGSKPFKCTKCNYSCVNKSMLNSHMKSHTNVYQYRCADCTYATKYCHSLKLHLRKYGHKPATVLNSDGSLPQGIDADISGLSLLAKRGPPRGPRGLRGKDKDGGMGDAFLPPTMCPPLYMTPGDMSPMNPLLNRGLMPGPYWPMIANRMHPPPPLIPVTGMGGPRHPFLPGFEKLNFGPDPEHDAGGSERDSSSAIKCNMCSYSAETIDSLEAHVLKVHAAENRDLLSVLPFNITSESLLEEQAQRMQARRMSAPPGQTGGVPVSSAHAPSGQDTSPDAYLRRHTMPGAESSPLRVHTKQIISELIKSNPSWPRSMHGGEMNGERAFPSSFYRGNGRDRDREQEADMRDAPQEGADILRQMTLKFGASVPASSPSRPPLPVPAANLDVASVPSPLHGALDLTKPRSLTSPYIQSPPSAALMADFPHGAMPESLKRKLSGEANSSEDNSCPGDVPMVNPRKRSRKGKAYKLDALCLKLQEKHTASPYDSDCEDSPPTPEAPRPGETEADKKDEDEYDDYSDRRVERSVGTEHPGRTAELERLQRENSDMDAREQEENASMMDNEFQQLQKNLQILNSDAQSADACGHNMPEESSLRQPSSLDETTLNEGRQSPEKSPMTRDAVDDSSPPPLTREDSHEPEDSIKNRASIISAIYQSQHDAVPPAVRRGTELALKIFKETTGRTSPPISKTSEPDFPLPIPPPSVSAPSHKNSMSHDLHKIALSKQPLNVCGPSRSPVTLLPARMSTHAQTQPPAAAKIMEEMGLASKLMPPSPRKEIFECPYCDISFRNGVMFSMHMGYHGSPNPYKCNICGQISRDSVDFFLHIARNAHT